MSAKNRLFVIIFAIIAILSLAAAMLILYDPFSLFEKDNDAQNGSGTRQPVHGTPRFPQPVDGVPLLSTGVPLLAKNTQPVGIGTSQFIQDARFSNINNRHSKTEGTAKAGTSVRVPILTYHHFAEEGDPSTVISAEMFERQIVAIIDAGYTAISFSELCDFVHRGTPLPENPIIITIDDGYLSVYETAFPILRKYDAMATVFIIGVTHGQTEYKDTGYPITPRFNDIQALKMARPGIISIQSHSYDMHQYEPFETGRYRTGVLQMEDEDTNEYIASFTEDFERAASQIVSLLGTRPFVFAYPFGYYSELTETLLAGMGVKATLTIQQGMNTVVANSPESLFALRRFNVSGDMGPEELLELITH